MNKEKNLKTSTRASKATCVSKNAPKVNPKNDQRGILSRPSIAKTIGAKEANVSKLDNTRVKRTEKRVQHKNKRQSLLKRIEERYKLGTRRPALDLNHLTNELSSIPITGKPKDKPTSLIVPKSNRAKKCILENEKKRFQLVSADPIFQKDPLAAVQFYLQHKNSN